MRYFDIDKKSDKLKQTYLQLKESCKWHSRSATEASKAVGVSYSYAYNILETLANNGEVIRMMTPYGTMQANGKRNTKSVRYIGLDTFVELFGELPDALLNVEITDNDTITFGMGRREWTIVNSDKQEIIIIDHASGHATMHNPPIIEI